ncbi:MAG: peptidoglycan-binding protein [Oscillospiraceae bacterium]|jgi:murein L,D-transpeptidase YcbB/YkuD|nr:peptidoglycan-binding protein [Oscillospiraceae bacterium]
MFKRLVSCLLCALLVVVLAAPALAETEVVTLPAQALLRANAQLREKPTTESASKMILRKGSMVTVLEVKLNWLYVQYGNFHGYLHSDLIDTSTLTMVGPGAPKREPETATQTNPATTARTLRYGAKGSDVRSLQQALLALGYDEVGAADGAFGKRTRAAVQQFQSDRGLSADGIVGVKTWAMLSAALQ